MKPLVISDAETMCMALQDEIRRSGESRYDHRLHGVLLVAQGVTCPEVGRLLGDSARSVQYWVHRFEAEGFAGLAESDRPGRPSRLSERQMEALAAVLRQSPLAVGLGVQLWDAKTLARFIEQQWNTQLGVRQCQRLFRQLGFGLRKPRPVIAQADPERQAAHKKTPQIGPDG